MGWSSTWETTNNRANTRMGDRGKKSLTIKKKMSKEEGLLVHLFLFLFSVCGGESEKKHITP